MPRQATPLTDTKIKSLKPKSERYRVSDTGGLMLEVMPSGSKAWRYRYQLHGVRHPALTIGNYPDISLAEARKRWAERDGCYDATFAAMNPQLMSARSSCANSATSVNASTHFPALLG